MNQTPDIIGIIYQPTGQTLTDSEGNEYPEMAPIAGYHVNTPEPVPEWEQYLCDPQPETPYRVYAGGIMPVCYVFPDEQTFKQHFQEPEELAY